MITETMTVHEALSELKTLDKRIAQKIADGVFVRENKHSNTRIDGKSIEDYKANILSAYDSICALIQRRAALRGALSASNAATRVTIGGREYSVAEALEMKKNGSALKTMLLANLVKQYKSVKERVEFHNGVNLEREADNYIVNFFGGRDKVSSEDAQAAREAYIASNTFDMIDPLDVYAVIQKLEEEIARFTSEVDAKLSVCNALTQITIQY